MKLKAGTYRFNPDLNFDGIPFEYYEAADTYLYLYDINFQLDDNTKFQIMAFAKYPYENNHFTMFSYQTSIELGGSENNVMPMYSDTEIYDFPRGWVGEIYEVANETLQTHTITQDTDVDDTFGTWYIANTNYNEVNSTEVTFDSIKAKMQVLIDKSNAKTGKNDTDLYSAVESLLSLI